MVRHLTEPFRVHVIGNGLLSKRCLFHEYKNKSGDCFAINIKTAIDLCYLFSLIASYISLEFRELNSSNSKACFMGLLPNREKRLFSFSLDGQFIYNEMYSLEEGTHKSSSALKLQ